MFLCPKLNNCSSFFSGLCFICLSGVQCICLYICLYPFSIHICISGLCSLCPAVSPMFLNVSSAIKNLLKSARTYCLCVFLFCVSPQWCPHCAICFVGSGPQLPIWHQNPINCIPMYILNRADECTISIVSSCTSSISLTSVYTYNLNTAAVSTSYEKCIICLESPPKNLISKCVFYWLKHGAASKPCVSASSSAGKKAQNWGFEITNVRYGHQPAFCRHFNDGSNSCFQTTNWNAAQAGYRQAFCKIVN